MQPEVPEVRLLGRTWADRGWRYWNRRFWLALAYGLMAAFEVGLAIAIWSSLMHSIHGQSAKVAVSVVIVVLIAGGAVWALRSLWVIVRAERRADIATLRAIAAKNAGRSRTAGGAAGLGLGVGTLAGIPGAAVGLLVGTFAVIGWVFVFFLMGLMRYLSVEEYLAVHDLTQSRAHAKPR
jgi:hypothetical protein